MNAVRGKQQVTATAFAAKYKSKREVYNFLAIDVKCYLPAYDTITIYFLKDLVSGVKKSMFPSSCTNLLPLFSSYQVASCSAFVSPVV